MFLSLLVLHLLKLNGMSLGTAPRTKSLRLIKSKPGVNFFHSASAGETIFDKINPASALLLEFKAAIFIMFSNTILSDSVANTPAFPPFFLPSSLNTNP